MAEDIVNTSSRGVSYTTIDPVSIPFVRDALCLDDEDDDDEGGSEDNEDEDDKEEYNEVDDEDEEEDEDDEEKNRDISFEAVGLDTSKFASFCFLGVTGEVEAVRVKKGFWFGVAVKELELGCEDLHKDFEGGDGYDILDDNDEDEEEAEADPGNDDNDDDDDDFFLKYTTVDVNDERVDVSNDSAGAYFFVIDDNTELDDDDDDNDNKDDAGIETKGFEYLGVVSFDFVEEEDEEEDEEDEEGEEDEEDKEDDMNLLEPVSRPL